MERAYKQIDEAPHTSVPGRLWYRRDHFGNGAVGAMAIPVEPVAVALVERPRRAVALVILSPALDLSRRLLRLFT